MRTLKLLAWAAGLTLLTTQALAQAPEEAARHTASFGDADSENDIRLQLTAGAALAYGNARNFAGNFAGLFNLREGSHAFLAEVGWIIGATAARGADPMAPNEFGDFDLSANNLTGRLRYDYFIDSDNSVFGVFRIRRDSPFANLAPRVQGQLGYLRNLLREEKHRFWFELGVDITYDNFTGTSGIALSPTITSDDRSLFAARGFIGYSNEINSVLTYNTGLEVLWVLARAPLDTDLGHLRFEWINQFRSQLEDWLQISLDITGRLDSQPPGQASPWDEQGDQPVQMFDLVTTLNLVGNFDLDGSPEEEAEEEPECPEPEPCPECAPPADGAAPAIEPAVEGDAPSEPETSEPEAAGQDTPPASDAEPAPAAPTEPAPAEPAPADA